MSIKQLVSIGTKVWSDSVEPKIIASAVQRGISGATSNPIIISDIIKEGGLDERITQLIEKGLNDSAIAWKLNDELVTNAQRTFAPIWQQTKGNDGYVSFELDPLLEDPDKSLPHGERVRHYIELGIQYSNNQTNRMIKVPATAAGLDCLEELAAHGVTLNVTLCFTERQYKLARDAIWRGAQRRRNGLDGFKSVYSIFVSRVDVYTEKNVPDLTKPAQGLVGIVNAKQMWRMNAEFWRDKNVKLQQEIIFASTGKKLPWQAEDYYVENLAGSDIQTNPPATNDYIDKSDKIYRRTVDEMPPREVLDEIARKVDVARMEAALMSEGIKKFADPQKALEKLIGERRGKLQAAR
ncbi:MAG: transaldolase [Phycisphaerales bacterium]|jgi:transaldolase|nr:transaldolase [Phycisphaerales bacterium]